MPTYTEADIAQSVELNLAMDLQRQGQTAPGDANRLAALRSALEVELRTEIAHERQEILKGLAVGAVALLVSLVQLIWWRRLARS